MLFRPATLISACLVILGCQTQPKIAVVPASEEARTAISETLTEKLNNMPERYFTRFGNDVFAALTVTLLELRGDITVNQNGDRILTTSGNEVYQLWAYNREIQKAILGYFAPIFSERSEAFDAIEAFVNTEDFKQASLELPVYSLQEVSEFCFGLSTRTDFGTYDPDGAIDFYSEMNMKNFEGKTRKVDPSRLKAAFASALTSYEQSKAANIDVLSDYCVTQDALLGKGIAGAKEAYFSTFKGKELHQLPETAQKLIGLSKSQRPTGGN